MSGMLWTSYRFRKVAEPTISCFDVLNEPGDDGNDMSIEIVGKVLLLI
ncbi:hypothetical protein [Methanococcoides sp.]|nr:hypothetical protein [Methanococcoides sp.]